MAAMVLVVSLIVLQFAGVFPLGIGDFAFFTVIALLVALYRPAWGFLFFVALLPLETVNIAPADLGGVAVRPYQLLGAVTLVAIVVHALSRRRLSKLIKFGWHDLFPLLVVIGGVLSVLNAPASGPALKQAIIVASFFALYILTRHFVRSCADAAELVPFVLGSGCVASVFAIWQNVRFSHGLESFEVMAGRPNATFSEPDWLGMYMALLIGIVLAFLVQAFVSRNSVERKTRWRIVGLYSMLILFVLVLVLTVARSAWLGAALAAGLAVVATVTGGSYRFKNWQWKRGGLYAVSLCVVSVAALGMIHFFHLTTFDLSHRGESTASGWQSITIACDHEAALPEHIASADELSTYGCRHINLEDIDQEQAEGRIVREIYRDDPTVSIRRQTYGTALKLIGEHPVLGIGWGSAGSFLGTDSRGAVLNASNIFFEVWLGSGLLGVIALVVWLGMIGTASVRVFLIESQDKKKKTLALAVILSGASMLVFDLFNSGILLGFVWVWLGVAPVFLLNQPKHGTR